jgi:hypothetical protein
MFTATNIPAAKAHSVAMLTAAIACAPKSPPRRTASAQSTLEEIIRLARCA